MRGKKQTNELPFIGALFKCHIQDTRWRRVSAHKIGIRLPQTGCIFREVLGQLRILANTVSVKGLYLAWPLYSECHHFKKVQTDALALKIFPLRLVGKDWKMYIVKKGNLLRFYSETSWLT